MNAMLHSSGMPANMWREAIPAACYVLNRIPHKNLDKTPYEFWRSFKPNMRYLKLWVCLEKIGLPDFRGAKFDLTLWVVFLLAMLLIMLHTYLFLRMHLILVLIKSL